MLCILDEEVGECSLNAVGILSRIIYFDLRLFSVASKLIYKNP